MSITITETSPKFAFDAQEAVDAALATESKKENAANAFTTSLNSEVVKKRAYDDVKELARTIREIRTMFGTINLSLLRFDSEKFKDENGEVLQLGGEWKKRIDRFENIMQASYENARSAVDVMKEITAILGTDIVTIPVTYEDLKTEIDSFIATISEKKESALVTKDSFRELADDVRIFAAQIDVVLKDASGTLKAELAAARQHVINLTQNLERIDKEIRFFATRITAAFSVGAAAGILALFTLSPIAAGCAIGSVATAATLKKFVAEKTAEKKNTEAAKAKALADVSTVLARQKSVEEYVKEFESAKTQIKEVAQKIDTITNIWQTLNLDMTSLAESLEKNVSRKAPITKFFWIKLAPTKETYQRLTECLETYVEQSQAVYSVD